MSASSYISSDKIVTTQLTPTYGVERLLVGDAPFRLGVAGPADPILYMAPDDGNYRFVTKVVVRTPTLMSPTGLITSVSLGAGGWGYAINDVLSVVQTSHTNGTLKVTSVVPVLHPVYTQRYTSFNSKTFVSNPRGSVTTSSNLFVLDPNNAYGGTNNRILKLSYAMSFVSECSLEGVRAQVITSDETYLYYPDGELTGYEGSNIYKRRCSDFQLTDTFILDRTERPVGLATDGTFLYIADGYWGIVEKRNCDDMTLVARSVVGGAGYAWKGMTLAGGYLWLTRDFDNKLLQFDPNDLSLVSDHAYTFDALDIPTDVSSNDEYLFVVVGTSDGSNRVRMDAIKISDLTLFTTFGSRGSGAGQFGSCLDLKASIHEGCLWISNYDSTYSANEGLQLWSLFSNAVETVTLINGGSGYSVASGLATTVVPSGGTGATINIVTVDAPIEIKATGTFGSDVGVTNWGSFSLEGMLTTDNYFGTFYPSITGGSMGLDPADTFNVSIVETTGGVYCRADIFGFLVAAPAIPHPHIISFTAVPSTIAPGGTTTLTPTFENSAVEAIGTGADLEHFEPIIPPPEEYPVLINGHGYEISPAATITYTLLVANGIPVTDYDLEFVTVTVSSGPPLATKLMTSSEVVDAGTESFTLTPTFENADISAIITGVFPDDFEIIFPEGYTPGPTPPQLENNHVYTVTSIPAETTYTLFVANNEMTLTDVIYCTVLVTGSSTPTITSFVADLPESDPPTTDPKTYVVAPNTPFILTPIFNGGSVSAVFSSFPDPMVFALPSNYDHIDGPPVLMSGIDYTITAGISTDTTYTLMVTDQAFESPAALALIVKVTS